GPVAGPVLAVTSDRRGGAVPLDPTQEAEGKGGDKGTVTLPGGANTPGGVTSGGKGGATTPPGPGLSPPPTIPVLVKLTDPKTAGTLDQAPVTVKVAAATARDVLAVPVTALVARSPGGYVVEVVGPGNTRRWVPVTPGIFDDTSGLVQVTGALAPGQRIVVPAT